MTRGAYCLVMRLESDREVNMGRNPPARFPGGFYCYVGSAMNSLEKRISRHKSGNKKLRWHIDWFLEHARIIDVKIIESNKNIECRLSQEVAGLSDGIPMEGFGSSDCSTCKAHLYYFKENPLDRMEELVREWSSS